METLTKINQTLPTEVITNQGISLSSPALWYLTEQAKSGNYASTIALISKILTPARLENIRQQIGDTSQVILVPILPAKEATNILPLFITNYLCEKLRVEKCECLYIIRKNGVKHRQNLWQRLANNITYGYDSFNNLYLSCRKVYLVDDHFTTSSTARDAIKKLNDKGIPVAGVISLGSSFSLKFRPTETQRDTFKQWFGEAGQEFIESVTGKTLYELTYNELWGILRTRRTLDQLKSKFLPAN